MSSNQLANSLGESWKSLGKNQKNNMIRYGLTENDWNELQKIGSFNARLWNPNANKLENYITRDWILENGGNSALANKSLRILGGTSLLLICKIFL